MVKVSEILCCPHVLVHKVTTVSKSVSTFETLYQKRYNETLRVTLRQHNEAKG